MAIIIAKDKNLEQDPYPIAILSPLSYYHMYYMFICNGRHYNKKKNDPVKHRFAICFLYRL
jgi:hypothetical protein